jgi:hypothetical protein
VVGFVAAVGERAAEEPAGVFVIVDDEDHGGVGFRGWFPRTARAACLCSFAGGGKQNMYTKEKFLPGSGYGGGGDRCDGGGSWMVVG